MLAEDIKRNAPKGCTMYLITIYDKLIYGKINQSGVLECYYHDEGIWRIPVAQNTILSAMKPLSN